MSWTDLARLGITLRPFESPPPSGGIASPFEASFSATLEILRRELEQLKAERIVLQVGYREQDLRLDGMPRASASMIHNGVAISFESKWGPLRYETNEFVKRGYRSGGEGWQSNLRAIALGMEALRKVDRYGVSKRGEQYKGWAQLPASTDPADQIMTHDQAWRVIAKAAGIPADSSPLLNGIAEERALRDALRNTHPDRGGDSTEFRSVMRAKEILGL